MAQRVKSMVGFFLKDQEWKIKNALAFMREIINYHELKPFRVLSTQNLAISLRKFVQDNLSRLYSQNPPAGEIDI